MLLKRSGKIRLAILLLITLVIVYAVILIFSGDARRRLRIIFSPACIQYKQGSFSNKLTDRIVDYSSEARRTGIKECRDENDIKAMLSDEELVKISSGRSYIIGKLNFSYPYLTKESKELLEEIATRFREKADRAGLRGSRFTVTSMIRTTEQMKQLRRINSNASANSPHLNGNAFDISYARFRSRKLFIT